MYENIYSLQSEAIVLLLTLFCPYTHAPSIVHCTSPPYLGYLCKALGPPMGGYPADLAKDRIVTVGSLVLCPSLASPSLVHCAPYPIVLPVQRPGRLRQGTLWIILVGSVIHLLGTVRFVNDSSMVIEDMPFGTHENELFRILTLFSGAPGRPRTNVKNH